MLVWKKTKDFFFFVAISPIDRLHRMSGLWHPKDIETWHLMKAVSLECQRRDVRWSFTESRHIGMSETVAVCCSVLQCVAVLCLWNVRDLTCDGVYQSESLCVTVAVCCSVLQFCCSVLQFYVVYQSESLTFWSLCLWNGLWHSGAIDWDSMECVSLRSIASIESQGKDTCSLEKDTLSLEKTLSLWKRHSLFGKHTLSSEKALSLWKRHSLFPWNRALHKYSSFLKRNHVWKPTHRCPPQNLLDGRIWISAIWNTQRHWKKKEQTELCASPHWLVNLRSKF